MIRMYELQKVRTFTPIRSPFTLIGQLPAMSEGGSTCRDCTQWSKRGPWWRGLEGTARTYGKGHGQDHGQGRAMSDTGWSKYKSCIVFSWSGSRYEWYRMLNIFAHSTFSNAPEARQRQSHDVVERVEWHVTQSSTHQKRDRNRVLVMSA